MQIRKTFCSVAETIASFDLVVAVLHTKSDLDQRGKFVSQRKAFADLRTVAAHVGLAPCSVSAVLNGTQASLAIPQHTKDRVLRAAAELNYRPNLSARSLRTKRSHLVAVVSDNFGRPAVGHMISRLESLFRQRGYLLALGTISHQSEWLGLSAQLRQRGIEGVVAVGVRAPRELQLPTVTVHLGTGRIPDAVINDSEFLAELADSTVEAILSKIEVKQGPRTTSVVPGRSNAAYGAIGRRPANAPSFA